MEDIERIVCKYNPKVVAPQKRFEHRTGTDTFVQILLDKELKKEMEYQRRKNHESKDDKRNHQNNGMQVILNHGDNFIFLHNMDKIERSIRKRRDHVNKLAKIRIGLFITNDRSRNKAIHQNVTLYEIQKIGDRVHDDFVKTRLVREIRK